MLIYSQKLGGINVKKKIIIVGASHGGHQSILELLSRYEDIDITLFEAGNFVSFMSCGMELYLENSVTDVNAVRNFRPESFPQENVHILNNHQVTKINSDKRTVFVTDLENGKQTEESYDKLILSSGVNPKSLPIAGNELENVYLMRGYDWATKIKSKLENPEVKNITVVGAGYIGIEAAEAAVKAGKHVTLLDVIDRPLGTYLDSELTDIISAHLADKGVEIHTGVKISAFSGQNNKVQFVKSNKGDFPSDVVIQAAGVQPNSK